MLHALNQFVAAFFVTERDEMIVLTVSQILTYTGSVRLGSFHARVLIATVRLFEATLGTIFQFSKKP